MADGDSKSRKLIPLRPPKGKKASDRKWGKNVMGLGFCIVPSLLLWAQPRLRLKPTQLAILMHLADFWWDAERKPYPSKKTLGERLGLSGRQVQRYIAELEKMKLVRRIERRARGGGKQSNFYDLSGLVTRLKELEPQFRQVKERAESERRRVSRPGTRHRIATAAE